MVLLKSLRPGLAAIAALAGLAMIPSVAHGHAITTDYRLLFDQPTEQNQQNQPGQSSQLEIQSSFSEIEAFPNAPVLVYSPENPDEPWLIGRTDENGKFTFEPEPGVTGIWSVEIGEDSHWDQLYIPVGDRGIELDQISQSDRAIEVPNHTHSPIPFAAAGLILGGIATRRLWQRSQP